MVRGLEFLQVDQLAFVQSKKVLNHCIVQAVAFAAHTLSDTFASEHLLVLSVLVMPALV